MVELRVCDFDTPTSVHCGVVRSGVSGQRPKIRSYSLLTAHVTQRVQWNLSIPFQCGAGPFRSLPVFGPWAP